MTRRRARSIPGAAALRRCRPRRPPPGGPPPRPRPARRPGQPPPHHVLRLPEGPGLSPGTPRRQLVGRPAELLDRPEERQRLLEESETHSPVTRTTDYHLRDGRTLRRRRAPVTVAHLATLVQTAVMLVALVAGGGAAEVRDGGRRPGRDGGLRRTGRGPEP
ncbi:hypothetical protein AB0F57_04055 [Streptomyces tanashiensis]|uniref:hypothetical protein n=1 Tax=Streptomyces tanashiensis TaxID=67367 RepID=UPI0033DE9DE3